MADIRKWSPLRIPDAFRQHSSKTGGSDDPMDAWDASDWDDPDAEGWKQRLTPNHQGQWLILGAIALFAMGVVLWTGQFVPLTSRNPWTFVVTLWPASLLVVYVLGRETGFMRNQDLDWAFVTTGRTVRVLPGRFVERFGEGDVKHVKFALLKSRSHGAFNFNFLKLGDLEANRDKLMTKASGTNRGPDSPAHLLLPGALTGENTDTVLGTVFGVHGGAVEFHDGGSETDMRVTNPSTLDDDVAGDVLNRLELFDKRVIPMLKEQLQTVETQKNQYKQRAEAERDPELERMFQAMETVTDLVRRPGRARGSEDNSEVEEISDRAKEQVDS